MGSPRILKSGIVGVTFGENVTVIEPSNLYGCEIGDSSFIGPFVEVQRNVRIGAKCRIQSHSFICEEVTIGNGCFISHGVMFINDLMRSGQPSYERSEWKATTIGDNVVIGTNATILPVKICSGAVIGAGAVVTKDILEPGFYVGNPARFLKSI